MTRGWAEKQRLGDLPAYAKAEGSDIQQFASFDEEAQMLIEGGETAKMRPRREQPLVCRSRGGHPRASRRSREAHRQPPEQGVRLHDHRPEDPGEPGALPLAADSGRRQLPPVRADQGPPGARRRHRARAERHRGLAAARGRRGRLLRRRPDDGRARGRPLRPLEG